MTSAPPDVRAPRARTLIRLPSYVVGGIFIVAIALFIATSFELSFQSAWEIMFDLTSPFGTWEELTLPLSAVGFLLVPAAISFAIVEAVTSYIEGQLVTKADLNDALEQEFGPRKDRDASGEGQ